MIFTAEARVLASFTFISCLVLGAWTGVERVFLGSPVLPDQPDAVRFLVALVPVVATGVAFQAARATELSWARSLGGAAVLLGVLSSLAGISYAISAY